jgi:hypothetical protein
LRNTFVISPSHEESTYQLQSEVVVFGDFDPARCSEPR